MAQSVKCWLYKHKDPSLVLGTHPFKIARCDDTYNLSVRLRMPPFGEEGTRGFLEFLDKEPNLTGNPRSL